MADIRRILPEEARQLLDQGYVYIDVRSEPEFELGHVPGAFNVPLRHRGPTGMVDNPDFLRVMEQAFGKGERLLLGCGSGPRSMKAAQVLSSAGYTDLVELKTGWDGSRDAFGRLEPGWSKKGYPVETGAPEGRKYADVPSRKPGA